VIGVVIPLIAISAMSGAIARSWFAVFRTNRQFQSCDFNHNQVFLRAQINDCPSSDNRIRKKLTECSGRALRGGFTQQSDSGSVQC
jgi:hypothetical protein